MIRGMKKISQFAALAFFAALPSNVFAACVTSVISGNCITSYDEWISELWNWGLMISVPISVLMIAAAGFLYTTSEGNSDRIGLAKTLIVAVISGIGFLVLGRLLLSIIGVGTFWNV